MIRRLGKRLRMHEVSPVSERCNGGKDLRKK